MRSEASPFPNFVQNIAIKLNSAIGYSEGLLRMLATKNDRMFLEEKWELRESNKWWDLKILAYATAKLERTPAVKLEEMEERQKTLKYKWGKVDL